MSETVNVSYMASYEVEGSRAIIILADFDGNLLDYAVVAGEASEAEVKSIAFDVIRVAKTLYKLKAGPAGRVVEADITGDEGAVKVILDYPLVRALVVEH